ncbi:Chaperone ClpB [Mycobacteroides abscessus subsp. abscessus]|nr:Chaperone ClpB [Mycobacteroides abscessus subsp. abscessus]
MDSFNPTTKTQAALTAALQAATTAGNPEIRPAHLLVALLGQTDGIAAPLLQAVGVDPVSVRNEAQAIADRLPQVSNASANPQLSRDSIAAVTAAQHLATELNDDYVSTEHLLVGLATGDSDIAKLLVNHGATPQALRDAFVQVRGSGRVTSPEPEATFQALEKYSTDLTARAREGKLDPVIGRDTEIRRIPLIGFGGRVDMEFLEVCEPELIVCTFEIPIMGGTTELTMTWRLRPQDGGTELWFTLSGFDPESPLNRQVRSVLRGGAIPVLSRLGELLEGRGHRA